MSSSALRVKPFFGVNRDVPVLVDHDLRAAALVLDVDGSGFGVGARASRLERVGADTHDELAHLDEAVAVGVDEVVGGLAGRVDRLLIVR